MPNRSIPEIFTDVLTQLTNLASKEGQLARTEISEKVTQVAVGLGLIVGGAVLLIPALVVLLQAGVSALITSNVLVEPWSSLAVGGTALLLGLVLAGTGMNRLKADTLVPNKTIHQIQRDVSVAKRQARESHDQQQAA
jgi:Putative Actinobacterial Holin-X, holin superfamily III